MGTGRLRDHRAEIHRYMVEHQVNYTTAKRAVEAGSASTAPQYRPDTLVVDPRTGCWRSWATTGVAMLPPEVADDGEVLYGDITIGRERFVNDGLLQVRRGEAAAAWMQRLGAAVGSVHRDDQQCEVCHDRYEYGAPETPDLLEHRAHQVQAAFERRTGLGMGTSMAVTAATHEGRLFATLSLTDAARTAGRESRLLGFTWRSDFGWQSIVSAEAGEQPSVKGTLLGWDTWQPHAVAAEIEWAARHYV